MKTKTLVVGVLLIFLVLQKPVAQPLFEPITFPAAAINPVVNTSDPGVTNTLEWINADWRRAWWAWGDATIYAQSKENWIAVSPVDTTEYPAVTLFELDAASALRNQQLMDCASFEIVYNGVRATIWVFGNANNPDNLDFRWIGASGIGRPFINDEAGYLVRLNNNPASDRQFFNTIDVSPGNPAFNFNFWYGVFGHYSFNNSPFVNGLPNSRPWNHQVYELCFRGLREPWYYCAGDVWTAHCKRWPDGIWRNENQKELEGHIGDTAQRGLTTTDGYLYLHQGDTAKLTFYCSNLTGSNLLYNYNMNSALGALCEPTLGFFSLLAHRDTMLSISVVNIADIGQRDTITMTINSYRSSYVVLEGSGPLSKIDISPGNFTIESGDSIYLGAFGYDLNDKPLNILNPVWSTSGGINTVYSLPLHKHLPKIMQVAKFIAGNPGDGYVKLRAGSIADSVYVTITIKTPCAIPTGVTISLVTSENATISWTSPVPPPVNGYGYEVRTSGTPGSGLAGLAVSGTTASNTIAVTGLTGNTTYYFYIRSVCGNGLCSQWTDAYLFSTLTEPLNITSIVNGASCYGNANGAIITMVTGGIPPYLYQWSNGATSSSLTGLHAGTYWLTVTASNNAIIEANWYVNEPLPITTYISNLTNVSCFGLSDGSFTIGASGGTPPFLFSLNGNPSQPGGTFSGLAACNYTIIATDFNGCTSVHSFTITSPLAIDVGVTSASLTVCAGEPVTFTATITNGPPEIEYQWMANSSPISGATSSTYSYVPADGDAVTCMVTGIYQGNEPGCSVATPVIMHVTSLNSMLVLQNVVVANGQSKCFNATQHISAAGFGTTFIVESGTSVTMIAGNSIQFLPGTSLHLGSSLNGSVKPSGPFCYGLNPVPVSVFISASENPVCEGETVSFWATVLNPGTDHLYQWNVNGQNITGATDNYYAYQPSMGDSIKCMVSSSASCVTGSPATSNTIFIMVHPTVEAGLLIIASTNPACADIPVTFFSMPLNGGYNPAYQWYVNGLLQSGATNATYFYMPANLDIVYCVMTSNEFCVTNSPVTSDTIQMIINSPPPQPTSGLHIQLQTQITWNWNPVSDATGYRWNTFNDFNSAFDMGLNTQYTEYGLLCNTSYARYVWAYNDCSPSVSLPLIQSTLPCWLCGQTITDARDGKTYTTVQIGTQCWMAQNLNIGQRIGVGTDQTENGVIEKYCYNDLESNCDIYQGLYQWGEMLNYETSSNSNPSGRQGICPADWHLPSYAEWTQLTNYLGGEMVAGGKMKETGTAHWLSPNTGATNSSGFTALPGGERSWPGYFTSFQSVAYLYTCTESNLTEAWHLVLDYNHESCYISDTRKKLDGMSVRCLKNSYKSAPGETGSHTGSSQWSILVYPNPSKGSFTLEINGDENKEQINVTIYSLFGQKVLEETTLGLDKLEFSLGTKPPGIYILRVVTGKETGMVKVIKQ
jgi:uncharacterized protein (TIGR02145 family)